ncbi:MAG: M48 family metalloprotease [Desulfosarcinaceae bacterium]|nr:M48 family metalloprotease [Desulfosarcinaceae bacterium]
MSHRLGILTPVQWTRRDFLRVGSLAAAGVLTGCATNPVTGESQFMLVSEAQEIQMDRQHSPHQLSADYGVIQDKALNAYIERTGKRMAALTHRPQMPYRFSGVNATYVNAYAFPGGTIACTRGILLSLESEAELAALLGHELGHVNARHTAESMSKSMLTSAVVGGLAVYAGSRNSSLGGLAAQLGMLGSGVLLASYSRANERQADDLGMEYLVQSGYGPEGMVQLMDMLKSMSSHKMNATQLLFSTHPMSDERYDTAVATARNKYKAQARQPLRRERYMDNTARLRKLKPAIDNLQKAEALMAKKEYPQAEALFEKALKIAPEDYAALVLMSKCQLAQKKYGAAGRYSEKAKAVYPAEAQGYFLDGYADFRQKRFDAALTNFETYDQRLAGNPNTIFFKGACFDGKGQREKAANHYAGYLKVVKEGPMAQHAYQRLVDWGYLQQQ